jgi:hypothetical protein
MNYCLAFALYAATKAVMRYALTAISNILTEALHAALVVRFNYPNLAIHRNAANAYRIHRHLT